MLFKFLKNLFLVYFCVWLIALPAFGKEEIVEIKENESAPFAGILLNDQAAAKLLVNLDAKQETCQIFIDEAVEKKSVELNYRIDICDIKLETEKSLRISQVKLRDDHITNLEKIVLKRRVPNEIWFTLGVFGGVGITLAAGYALGEINNPQ